MAGIPPGWTTPEGSERLAPGRAAPPGVKDRETHSDPGGVASARDSRVGTTTIRDGPKPNDAVTPPGSECVWGPWYRWWLRNHRLIAGIPPGWTTPEGSERLAPGRGAPPGVKDRETHSDPGGVRAPGFAAWHNDDQGWAEAERCCDPSGVGMRVGPRYRWWLRNHRLIAGIPPGWTTPEGSERLAPGRGAPPGVKDRETHSDPGGVAAPRDSRVGTTTIRDGPKPNDAVTPPGSECVWGLGTGGGSATTG